MNLKQGVLIFRDISYMPYMIIYIMQECENRWEVVTLMYDGHQLLLAVVVGFLTWMQIGSAILIIGFLLGPLLVRDIICNIAGIYPQGNNGIWGELSLFVCITKANVNVRPKADG